MDDPGPVCWPGWWGLGGAWLLLVVAEDLTAEWVHEYSLMNPVVPHDEVHAAAADWAARLATGPSRSFALTRWLVN